MYLVYLLECKDGTIYTGITTNVKRRLEEHKNGIGSRYTRSRKVKRLLYTEKHKNRSSASKREAEIKRMPRKKKLDFVKVLPTL
ncbi:GIY-YIG nuclease family protein [Patescibacteria group bacterium]|nr:GIY-YIG nuclease family protein [Patescibacteria group bacterium]